MSPRRKGGKRGGGGAARGYKPGEVYLRPTSRAGRAYAVLEAESARVGRALTLGAWRSAFLAATGEPLEEAPTIAWQLKTRGFIVHAGGTTREPQYAVARAPQPATAVVQPNAVLLRVVEEGCAAAGAALPLAAVRAGLAAAGLERDSDQTSSMLEILCTVPQPVGAPDARVGVECVMARTSHGARTRRFWRPAGTAYAPPVAAPESRRAAMRAAITACAAALGRPVTPHELKLWAAAHPEHAAAAAIDPRTAAKARFTSALRNMVRPAGTRRRSPALESLVLEDSHPLTSGGGILLRVAPVGMAADERRVARFADTAYWLRPAQELAACAALREEEREVMSAGLGALADRREAATLRALTADLGLETVADLCTFDWRDLARRTDRAARTLAQWWRSVPRGKYAQELRCVEGAREVAVAASRLAETFEPARIAAPVDAAPALVGDRGLVSIEQAEGWLRELLGMGERRLHSSYEHLREVRRFPNPKCEKGPIWDPVRESFSLVDVGDVLRRLAAVSPDARVAVHLGAAAAVLGHVVRDAEVLRDLLTQLPEHDGYHRYGAVVALGALGLPVAPELAIREPHDRAGVEAYALSLGVAPLDPEERHARLSGLFSLVTPTLHDWVQELADRAGDGDTITVTL